MENEVKLAYVIEGEPYVVSLNSRKAARVLDQFLKEEFKDLEYNSKVIYDDDEAKNAQ